MAISLYDASIPSYIQALGAASAILKKAETWAAERKIDASVLINARLAPDMLPLKRQIQIATDGAKGVGARLSQSENPRYEDNEETFDDLQARIAKTVAFLKGLDKAAFDGSETRPISLQLGPNKVEFPTGTAYVTGFATANFFFHIAATYMILRENGLDIGKRDYIGAQL
ncbi:MAG: hypothetical protein BGN86_05000 [Caulobacterales bacterium 68-7]|mgnify:CR=1 FL=1|nr:MAG: hypothetical protein BGN86_05000 [Caulobacterales bacterium 68-7]